MTDKPDPLEEWIRHSMEAVSVPAGLETRIRETVARRRRRRLLAGFAAVAAVVLVGWASLFLFPGRPVPAPPKTVFSVSLVDSPPPPLELKGIDFTARVEVTEEGLAFRFIDGGKHNE